MGQRSSGAFAQFIGTVATTYPASPQIDLTTSGAWGQPVPEPLMCSFANLDATNSVFVSFDGRTDHIRLGVVAGVNKRDLPFFVPLNRKIWLRSSAGTPIASVYAY